MSDSSIPSVNRQDGVTEPTPYKAGSSASSLGAPAPDPDINGDPDQVS